MNYGIAYNDLEDSTPRWRARCGARQPTGEMERVCSVCRDAFAEMPPATATVELPAFHHVFCEECLGDWWSASAASGSNSCPDCRRFYSGLRRCPRSTAGAIAAASMTAQSAQPCASAAPKHQRHAGSGNDQAVSHEVESDEEDCEPVSKRRKKCVKTSSEYVGVSWTRGATSVGSWNQARREESAPGPLRRRARGGTSRRHGGAAAAGRGRARYLDASELPSKREGRAKALGMPAAH
jgi:hypothetical protein